MVLQNYVELLTLNVFVGDQVKMNKPGLSHSPN